MFFHSQLFFLFISDNLNQIYKINPQTIFSSNDFCETFVSELYCNDVFTRDLDVYFGHCILMERGMKLHPSRHEIFEYLIFTILLFQKSVFYTKKIKNIHLHSIFIQGKFFSFINKQCLIVGY